MAGESMIACFGAPTRVIDGEPVVFDEQGGGREPTQAPAALQPMLAQASEVLRPAPAQAINAAQPGMARLSPGDGTMARAIMRSHSLPADAGRLRIKFDSLISHDITYVGIIQTARASGLTRFPLPYALTCCHNSLCAVGGTINEDDHAYGLSAAKKYGGAFVPPNLAVIHQYAREMLCECGGMTLGSDSHTRYGALGSMGIGEGGPELVKQLLGDTYDIEEPEVVLVWLEGAPKPGVGPHDVAIALCGALYGEGFAKNKVLEFDGPGLAGLPMDFRLGVDVMTTETACLSSIWRTDDGRAEAFYERHGRPKAYRPIAPEPGAAYHALVRVRLDMVEPMIALPFHPSRAYKIREFLMNAPDMLREAEREASVQFGGKVELSLVDKARPKPGGGYAVQANQGIIAGCAGGMFDNIREAASILMDGSVGNDYFSLSVYPSSVPVAAMIAEAGIQNTLLEAGALFKPCFCGPCFGAGDVPANNALSVRHATRNFPNREGSRPGDGQLAAVALMDARSIAATAANGGVITPATEGSYRGMLPGGSHKPPFKRGIYEKRVYYGIGKPDEAASLRFGPNIADWPEFDALGQDLLLRLDSVLQDPVTTTDELIPSGETSSYRSNPIKLADFALSRRDPGYVARARETRGMDEARKAAAGLSAGAASACAALAEAMAGARDAAAQAAHSDARAGAGLGAPAAHAGLSGLAVHAEAAGSDASVVAGRLQIGSAIYAVCPGDGSAREQAASCQRVLGGLANVCVAFATKRYRSNVINWGMLPFTLVGADDGNPFSGAQPGDWLYVPNVRKALESGASEMSAVLVMSCGCRGQAARDGHAVQGAQGAQGGQAVQGVQGAHGVQGNRAARSDAGAGAGSGAPSVVAVTLSVGGLTSEERATILAGCLMNRYRERRAAG